MKFAFGMSMWAGGCSVGSEKFEEKNSLWEFEGMILSALLTSVGINFSLCFIFFILYSILRNQPSNAELYVPRLIAGRKFHEEDEQRGRRFMSSLKWVKRAWQPSEDELLENSGLDAVVFMRIFIFGLVKENFRIPLNSQQKYGF